MIPSVPARICYSYFQLAGSFKVSMAHENGSKIQENSIKFPLQCTLFPYYFHEIENGCLSYIRCGLGVGNALSTGPYSVFFTSFDTYTTNFVFESFWSMISGSEVLENFEF